MRGRGAIAAPLQAGHVEELDVVRDAMGVDAHEVGLDQDVGRRRGVVRGQAEALEDGGHVPAQAVLADAEGVLFREWESRHTSGPGGPRRGRPSGLRVPVAVPPERRLS